MGLQKVLVNSCGSFLRRQLNASVKLSSALAAQPRSYSVYHTGQNYPDVYSSTFRKSQENPEEFWGEHAEKLVWHKKWDKVLDNSRPPFTKWYVISLFFVWPKHGKFSVCLVLVIGRPLTC
jgi:hypothetical protein